MKTRCQDLEADVLRSTNKMRLGPAIPLIPLRLGPYWSWISNLEGLLRRQGLAEDLAKSVEHCKSVFEIQLLKGDERSIRTVRTVRRICLESSNAVTPSTSSCPCTCTVLDRSILPEAWKVCECSAKNTSPPVKVGSSKSVRKGFQSCVSDLETSPFCLPLSLHGRTSKSKNTLLTLGQRVLCCKQWRQSHHTPTRCVKFWAGDRLMGCQKMGTIQW